MTSAVATAVLLGATLLAGTPSAEEPHDLTDAARSCFQKWIRTDEGGNWVTVLNRLYGDENDPATLAVAEAASVRALEAFAIGNCPTP